jgi:hypothetical protein
MGAKRVGPEMEACMLTSLRRLAEDLTLLGEELGVLMAEWRSIRARRPAHPGRAAEFECLLVEEMRAHLRALRARRLEIRQEFDALGRDWSGRTNEP